MDVKIKVAIAGIVSALSLGAAGSVFAQAPAIDPGHPRVNEVERRLDHQQMRVDRGISDHQINARQAARDDAKLGREQASLNRDMARDRGHITKAQQRRLNHRLNRGSAAIHRQRDHRG
jgi:hypothetical protein